MIVAFCLFYLAPVVLAVALGLAIARGNAYKRSLVRVRVQRDKYREERDAALNAVDMAPAAPGPVWTTGAPPEAIDAAFDEQIRIDFLADGSDR